MSNCGGSCHYLKCVFIVWLFLLNCWSCRLEFCLVLLEIRCRMKPALKPVALFEQCRLKMDLVLSNLVGWSRCTLTCETWKFSSWLRKCLSSYDDQHLELNRASCGMFVAVISARWLCFKSRNRSLKVGKMKVWSENGRFQSWKNATWQRWNFVKLVQSVVVDVDYIGLENLGGNADSFDVICIDVGHFMRRQSAVYYVA